MRILLLLLLLTSIPSLVNSHTYSPAPAILANATTSYVQEFPLNRSQAAPGPVTVAPNGIVWFVETNKTRLASFDPATHRIQDFLFQNTSNYSISSSSVQNTISLTSDTKGNLWFSLYTANAIGYFNTTNQTFHYYNLTALTGHQTFPFGIAVDLTGNVWFAEAAASRIGKLNPATGLPREYNFTQPNATPYQVFIDSKGSPWVTSIWYSNLGKNSTSGSTLTKIDPTTGEMKTYNLSGSGILTPIGLAVDPTGRAWVGDHAGNWLGEVNTTSGAVKLHRASLPPLVPHPRSLTDRLFDVSLISYTIVLGPDGTPWFMEHYGTRVGHYIPTTDTMTEYNIPTAGTETPWLAADKSGGIWFTEFEGNKLGYLNSLNAKPSFSVTPNVLSTEVSQGSSVSLTLNVTNTSPNPINVTAAVDSTSNFGSPFTNATVQPGAFTIVIVQMNASASLQLGNYSRAAYLAYLVPVITVSDGNVNIVVTVNVSVDPASLFGASTGLYAIAGGLIIISAASGVTLLYWRKTPKEHDKQ